MSKEDSLAQMVDLIIKNERAIEGDGPVACLPVEVKHNQLKEASCSSIGNQKKYFYGV